jgi:AcrR family transcriptional regulator
MRATKPAAARMRGRKIHGEDRTARERLLATAGELFYRQGIRSVGIDEIIAKADIAKMSLYRSFPSKDALVAAYLRERDEAYWQWWDRVVAEHQGAPRDQILALFRSLMKRTARPDWRGCPFTNAATEFPERDHPGRKVAEANKRQLRRRLRDLARDAGAHDAEKLGDELVLLFEGAYSSAQTFGPAGPAGQVVEAAAALLAARLGG